jgi:SAM-dependent methyltransferase
MAELDPARAEAFAGKMMGMLNQSSLALLVSVGHQTGLFDEMAGMAPSTADDIARASGLQPRYVQEWLGGMVVGGIVEYDAAARTYYLPPEHAGFLTRAAGMNNMAFFAQYVALVGNVERKVVECFRRGGGVPYSDYPDFQRLQAEESAALYDALLVDAILPFVPGLVERLRAGIDVVDVGCGQGHAINVMARAFPQSRFVGIDFSEEGVAAGRAEARALGLANATFQCADVARPGALAKCDFITAFDTIHDQARPRDVLRHIAGALRPGGSLLMMDIAASSNLEENLEHPFGPFLYGASVFHCMTVSLAQGGEGLGTLWGEQKAKALLSEAGFREIEVRHLEGDPVHAFFVARV